MYKLAIFGVILSLSGCVNLNQESLLPAMLEKNRLDQAYTYPSLNSAPLMGNKVVNNLKEQERAWWQYALSDALTRQVDNMLLGNLLVAQAKTRVQQAEALLEKRDAQRGLTLDFEARMASQHSDDDGGNDDQSIGLDMNFPLDFFGRLEALYKAAQFDLQDTQAKLQQVLKEQVQNYLLAYVDLSENRVSQKLIESQIDTGKTLLRLIELRFIQGQAVSVDVLQQRDQLALLQQQIPPLLLAQRQALNRLALLTGQPPYAQTRDNTPLQLPEIKNNYARLKAYELAIQRPDLIQIRAQIMAADQRFMAALADQLPNVEFSSNALIRLASGSTETIISALLKAAFNVFDGGERSAESDAKRLELKRLGQQYIQTWLEAVVQVDDLLAREYSETQTLELSRQSLEVSRQLLAASKKRYKRGISDYLPVLAALRGLQQQERDYLRLEADQLRTRIRLHNAFEN